jgi:acyl dehydratase
MTLTVSTVDELRPRAGGELGASSYRLLSQDDVDAFAQITGDRQWIHTNPVRARETASGATIVHGYYTLQLRRRWLPKCSRSTASRW